MKVNGSQQITPEALKGKQAESKQGKPARSRLQTDETLAAPAPARVEISEQSKEAQKAAEISQKAPEVRDEKVQALKAKIEAGEYKVDSRKVADKILRQLLSELIR